MLKISALKYQYNFDFKIMITDKCIKEIQWWMFEGVFSGKLISHGNSDYIIKTDSSGFGWEAIMGNEKTQGLCSEEEIALHLMY